MPGKRALAPSNTADQHSSQQYVDPSDVRFLRPAGIAVAVLVGAVIALVVVLLGVWFATPTIGVGAAAALVGTVCLATAMLLPYPPHQGPGDSPSPR
ncbi:hypothetical protein [Rhodococcus jostii]|uniref:Uncharacterized protein n=1 Tax=Rhodococcus jostii TaxID=132919 RepID=A0A1H4TRK2_RHOJO|nr:hypothetical protein [Rhodococcus jostii]SEC58711.1 hypothetical protein SAMN04490220_2033 [Rhodococcus jostii]